mgnify:FL=1
MKKTIKTLLLSTIFLAFSAQAKEQTIELEDNSSLLHKWKILAESPSLRKQGTEVNISWEFKKNGTLLTKATDSRARTGAMTITVKYSVEDGVIKKQLKPSSDKTESCKVVEPQGEYLKIQKRSGTKSKIKIEDKHMILHCKYLYYYLEKQ